MHRPNQLAPLAVEHQGRTIRLSVVEAHQLIEAVEDQHNAAEAGWKLTAGFLTASAQALEQLGLADCTPTAAYCVWQRVAAAWRPLARLAELAEFYHVDPFDMPGEGQSLLMASMPRIRALRKIEAADFAGLDHGGIYDLYFAAFRDPAIATKARTQWIEAFVRQSCDAAATPAGAR